MHCHCANKKSDGKNESNCPIHGDDIDEMSVAASLGGGPATPLGTNAKGEALSDKEISDKMKSYDIYKKYRN